MVNSNGCGNLPYHVIEWRKPESIRCYITDDRWPRDTLTPAVSNQHHPDLTLVTSVNRSLLTNHNNHSIQHETKHSCNYAGTMTKCIKNTIYKPVNALEVLVWHQKEQLACKIEDVVLVWLSGWSKVQMVRIMYGSADATATLLPPLASLKSRMAWLSNARFPITQVVLKKAINCMSVCH